MKSRAITFFATALLVLAPAARAAAPRDEVLRLVPDNVGFCLLVQDLRDHAKAFLASPFLAKLCGTPLGAKIRNAPEAATLGHVKANIENSLGLTLAQLRDEIVGDAFVLAYRPGPVDQPELEQGLLALHARNPALLTQLIDRINTLQRQAGELKEMEARKYQGTTYFCRKLVSGTNFYFHDRGLLVFATGETILREALDRRSATGANDTAMLGQFQKLGLDRRLAALWINPRAFDAAVRQRGADMDKLRPTAWKTLLTYWHALDAVAVTLSVQKELELSLTLRARKDRLPEAGQRFLSSAAQPSDLWRRFPQDAILSVAGRIDIAAFVGMVADFLPNDARSIVLATVEKGLGLLLHKEVLTKILPQLGPDWGFCVLQPRPDEKGLIPPFVLALRIHRAGTGASPAQDVFKAVYSWVEPLVDVYNQLHGGTMALQSLLQDKVEVKYLTDDSTFPFGFRPAFAVKEGYLLIGSSPAALARFPAAAGPSTSPEVNEVPFARFAPQALSAFLKSRRAALTTYLALVHQLAPTDVSQRLDNLLATLELLDRVEVVKQSTSEQMSLILRVRTVEPLR